MNQLLHFILCSLCIVSRGLSEPDFPPAPPESYTAEIQYSFQGKFFLKDDDVTGISLYAVENVDNAKNRTEITWVYETQFESIPLVGSKRFIWNPNITVADKYLVIEHLPDPLHSRKAISCTSDPELKVPIEEIILGFSSSQPTRPSTDTLLYFGEGKFKNEGEAVANEIPCTKYTKRVDETFGKKYKIEADVTVFWSDPAKWHGSAGKDVSVPVSASIKGKIDNEEANIYMNYVDYYEATHDRVFYPIPDFWCKNSKAHQGSVPISSDRFMYEGELLFYYRDGLKYEQYILPTVEYYDFTDHVSIHEYKTVNLSSSDPFSPKGKFVRDVIDYQSGLVYKMDFVDGKCRVNEIDLDNSFNDIEVDEHGHIQMMSPGEFWGADKKHLFMNDATHRGLPVFSYLYIKDSLDQVVATYFDASNEFRPVPVRILTYQKKGYNDLNSRRELNIFGFESNPNSEFPTDITHCFPGEKLSHRILATSWTKEMEIYNELRFTKEVVRRYLARFAQITYIRIQNIEVLRVDPENKAIHFIFTLLDVHPALNVSKVLPDAVTNSLSTALYNLETALREGKVVFQFSGEGGEFIDSTPIEGSFQETTRDKAPNPTYSLKYSSGSMALLGIFMIIFGIIGGLVGYHFYMKSPYFRG